MDPIALTALFGRGPDWLATTDVSGGASGGRPLAVVARRKAERIVADLEAARAAVLADKELTEKGKARKLARIVRDAEHEARKLAEFESKLAGEVERARAAYKPQPAEAALVASVWAMLPPDPARVREIAHDALAAGDLVTVAAVEALSIAHPGHLSPADREAFRAARLEAEQPETARAIAVAAEAHGLIADARSAVSGYVAGLARDLPPADPEDGIGAPGPDGLRTISDAALADALAGGAA